MALELYRKKRNFKTTPEPSGRLGRRRRRGLAFVVQKHAASHLHYDFRLELDGVLLSWAVPKGPSLDPNDKRLAMHVEDHPLQYCDFEGVIPPKQYGSGTVLLWDRGTWLPHGDPAEGYRKGKLKFTLDGEKLHGDWTLVRSNGGRYGADGKGWLLIKEDDDHAQPAREGTVVDEHPLSVTTGRSLEAIAAARDREWHSTKSVAENVARGAVKPRRRRRARLSLARVKGARKVPLPDFIEPQLAMLVDAAPASHGWVHEMKYDGYRILARLVNGRVTLYSRNGKDWTDKLAGVAEAVAQLPVGDAWLDGEVVVLLPDGRSSFQALQNALSQSPPPALQYFVFDLPYVEGHDLRGVALTARKALLQTVLEGSAAIIHYSEHVATAGADYFTAACKLGLEGIISKRSDGTYAGIRSRDWLKVKCERRQEFVIVGYTEPGGARSGFGALLLAVREEGRLRYAGRVGTGFDEMTLRAIKARLDELAVTTPPALDRAPSGADARGVHWVRPELVAEVRFTEWTRDGTLRHPSFQGLREDKPASDVVRETPAAVVKHKTAEPRGTRIAGIALSHADKLLFPETGVTKRTLAEYYVAVADHLLPHLANRPLTLVRCPNGWNRQCFYQKNADASVDPAIDRIGVTTSDGPAQYMMANRVEALIALTQMGVIELHPWGSSKPKLGAPDRLIFDFDPDDDLPWSQIVEAVQVMRTLLAEIGLTGYLKTTGGKGLHVVVPIKPRHDWDTVKAFTKAVAELLVRTFPGRYTDKLTKSRRRGKIFIDYLRNAEGATAITAFGVRARELAPVATPIIWDELTDDLRFGYFNVANVPQRLKKLRRDPWAGFFDEPQSLTAAMMKRVGLKLP